MLRQNRGVIDTLDTQTSTGRRLDMNSRGVESSKMRSVRIFVVQVPSKYRGLAGILGRIRYSIGRHIIKSPEVLPEHAIV